MRKQQIRFFVASILSVSVTVMTCDAPLYAEMPVVATEQRQLRADASPRQKLSVPETGSQEQENPYIDSGFQFQSKVVNVEPLSDGRIKISMPIPRSGIPVDYPEDKNLFEGALLKLGCDFANGDRNAMQDLENMAMRAHNNPDDRSRWGWTYRTRRALVGSWDEQHQPCNSSRVTPGELQVVPYVPVFVSEGRDKNNRPYHVDQRDLIWYDAIKANMGLHPFGHEWKTREELMAYAAKDSTKKAIMNIHNDFPEIMSEPFEEEILDALLRGHFTILDFAAAQQHYRYVQSNLGTEKRMGLNLVFGDDILRSYPIAELQIQDDQLPKPVRVGVDGKCLNPIFPAEDLVFSVIIEPERKAPPVEVPTTPGENLVGKTPPGTPVVPVVPIIPTIATLECLAGQPFDRIRTVKNEEADLPIAAGAQVVVPDTGKVYKAKVKKQGKQITHFDWDKSKPVMDISPSADRTKGIIDNLKPGMYYAEMNITNGRATAVCQYLVEVYKTGGGVPVWAVILIGVGAFALGYLLCKEVFCGVDIVPALAPKTQGPHHGSR